MNTNEEDSSNVRRLEGRRMYGYSFGVLGQVLPTTLINAYILMFYVYVVGLDPLLTSIGTSLGSLCNAFGAPIFGYLSDKKEPGRFGKRRPFLMVAIPILVISLILIWMPPLTTPGESVNWGTAIYLWVSVIVFYTAYPTIRSSYLAMMADHCNEEENLLQISSIQAIMSILGTVVGIILPMILQGQLANPENPYHTTADGQFLLRILPILAAVIGIIALIVTIIVIVSIDESKMESCTEAPEKATLLDAIRSIVQPFTDKKYRKFLTSILFSNSSIRMMTMVLAAFFTYVLLFQGNEFLFFTLLLLPFAIGGFVIWTKKGKTIGLKKSYINSTLINGIAMISLAVILLPLSLTAVRIIAFILIGFGLSSLVASYILPNPIVSVIIDERQQALQVIEEEKNRDLPNAPEKKEKSLSGAYFGSLLFTFNIANAFGDILIGVLLSGNERNPTIITLILPLAAILFFIAVLVVRNIDLD